MKIILVKRMILLSVVLLVLSIGSLMPISAAVVWGSDFEGGNSEGWNFKTYYKTAGTNLYFREEQPIVLLEDDQLTLCGMSNDKHDKLTIMEHDSDIQYGSWSFDYEVEFGMDISRIIVIHFIAENTSSTLDYNLKNMDSVDIWGGFSLLLIYDSLWWQDIFETPGISLIRMNTSSSALFDQTILAQRYFSYIRAIVDFEPAGGERAIHITRSTEGEFNVYMDEELVLTATDDTEFEVGKFLAWTWSGNYTFDNIIINDDIKNAGYNTGALSIELFAIGSAMLVITMIYRWRRIK